MKEQKLNVWLGKIWSSLLKRRDAEILSLLSAAEIEYLDAFPSGEEETVLCGPCSALDEKNIFVSGKVSCSSHCLPFSAVCEGPPYRLRQLHLFPCQSIWDSYYSYLSAVGDLIFETDCIAGITKLMQNKLEPPISLPRQLHFASGSLFLPEKLFCQEDLPKIKKILLSDSLFSRPYEAVEFKAATASGPRWLRLTVVPLQNRGVILCCCNDIHQRKERELHTQKQLQKDSMTGLYNKRYTCQSIGLLLSNTPEGAFFILDIDDFKGVNDRFGHLEGDAVLNELSDRLRSYVPGHAVIGRVGGDEFVIFLSRADGSEAERQARRLMDVFRLPFLKKHQISGSIGIALSPSDGKDYTTLFSRADKALYYAKRLGKNCFCFYQGGLPAAIN